MECKYIELKEEIEALKALIRRLDESAGKCEGVGLLYFLVYDHSESDEEYVKLKEILEEDEGK